MFGTESKIEPQHTAIWRTVVGKSACDNSERYCGWFSVHCSSKKFKRMAQKAKERDMFASAEGKQPK